MATSTSGSSDDMKTRTQQSPLASQRAKEQGQGQAGRGRGGRYFPLSYKEGFSQWWTNISPAMAEHTVLSYIPYLQQPPTHKKTGSESASAQDGTMPITDDSEHAAHPVTTGASEDPYGPRTWASNLIQLNGKNRALNEFSVERVGEKVEDNLVMLHGYGAGLSFFYKNFEGLSRAQGWRLFALDLLGMGRSSRPSFRVSAKDPQGKITEVENWFIDALEEWRIKKEIDKFTLLGHSLGGYMAVAYALKYPGHLNKLILASPVGVPEDPYAVSAEMPEPQDSTLQNEFTQDQEEETTTHSDSNSGAPKGDNNNFLNSRSKADDSKAEHTQNTNTPRRPLPKWLTYLWDANVSPFSLVRWGGPLGPRFVSGWTSRRFSHLPPEESQALHNYSYSLFRQRGSGEYALAYVLAPGAFARSPLIRRIQGVGRQYINAAEANGSTTNSNASNGAKPTSLRETGVPVVFVYGENDWMDVAGGYAAVEKMRVEKEMILREASSEERACDQGDAKVLVVSKAGHHVYLDGFEEFNRFMRDELDDVVKRRKQLETASES